jgi:hypothetical protein
MVECAGLRRLAWTKGRRLALVPREAGVGNGVALVKRGDMPLVMRPYWETAQMVMVQGCNGRWLEIVMFMALCMERFKMRCAVGR